MREQNLGQYAKDREIRRHSDYEHTIVKLLLPIPLNGFVFDSHRSLNCYFIESLNRVGFDTSTISWSARLNRIK